MVGGHLLLEEMEDQVVVLTDIIMVDLEVEHQVKVMQVEEEEVIMGMVIVQEETVEVEQVQQVTVQQEHQELLIQVEVEVVYQIIVEDQLMVVTEVQEL